MTELFPAIECEFSPCRRYRYTWRLRWDTREPPCTFIGLNPSTADEQGPDPTVRRCISYAKLWGYGGLTMLNLFAFRATDPKAMLAEPYPVGPANNGYIFSESGLTNIQFGIVIAAWGNHGVHLERSKEIRESFRDVMPLHYLTMTKSGEPGHPLYLKGDLKPRRWV